MAAAVPRGLRFANWYRVSTVANRGRLVIVFNQRSLVAFLWVGELVRTEGWRGWGLEGISRLAGGLLRCICRHDGMCEERGPFRKYPRRPASPCSTDAVGYPLVRPFRGRFIRGSGFTSVK